jgi:sec-independent protein translocase protein TatB
MFGMGGTEILVILIVALLFLGPDKLPEAAKQISKGIRDIKKQSRVLQQTIEDDEHIGGAIRDLKSALRGDEEPIRPRPIKPKQIDAVVATAVAGALPEPTPGHVIASGPAVAVATEADPAATEADPAATEASAAHAATEASAAHATAEAGKAALSMPPTAGEPDHDVPAPTAAQDAELASLVKPAPNTIARGAAPSIAAAATISTASSPATASSPSAAADADKPTTEPAVKSEPEHG